MESHTQPKPKPTQGNKEPEGDTPTEEPERLYHVRMSRPGDRMQEVVMEIVDPITYKPHESPIFMGIRVTERYRPDMERRSRRPKFNIRPLQVVFMTKTEVFNHRGERTIVGLRRGDANHWGPEDVIHNAVDEYNVPESIMPKFAPFIKLGHAVVDPLPEDAIVDEIIPGREAIPFGPEPAGEQGATVKPYKAKT